ncbi:TrlF family AAA-like ATPase [Verrucomicrobium sp. 3C]|uniref:TrlF family AAA-like ATPase n=1 Tax=Verrucomicrobium sp. 3C TaxID=1134055 RepID=UPI00039BC089|nr:AAA family ATPase [Verrucomicrobium sp. 3C]
MTIQDPSARASTVPAGAVFHRCALQVNPHSYGGTFRGQSPSLDAAAHAKAMVDRAVELGISVLAITDHNDVSAVSTFRAAAEGSPVHVFPGFELSSSEGVHVLCIYSADTNQDQLGRFLGGFGITKTRPSSDLANLPFVEVLRKVRDQGGIAVAAHVTSEQGGMLQVLKGQARIHAWRSEDLLAIQIPGPVEDLPPDVRPIIENKNPDYCRDHPAEERLAIAVVNANDVLNAEDLADRAASCWIKMSEVGIEGLRQAFLDPGSRIRLNPKEGKREPEEHAELVELAWEGGFLDGAAVRFNPNLNVLVGGRGTGKSTIVESIRAVLGLDPIGDEARKAHEGIVRHVLRSGTKISLRARAHRPTVREYTIERTIPNRPIVKDDRGEVSNLAPQEILPRIEVFGQHEISELTKSRAKLTRLLDRFVDRDETLPRRKVELRRELEKSRRSLVEARAERKQIEERLATLPGLEETLKQFKEAGLEERLRDQSLLVREERILASIPERLAPLRECLESLKREAPMDRAFLSTKALDALPGRAILERFNAVFDDLDRDLKAAAELLDAALRRADQGVAAVRRDWDKRRQEVEAAYEKILRDLQRSRVDGEEFIRLRRQIEELRPLREWRYQAQRLEKELVDRRRNLLAEWEDCKAQEFRRLDRAAKKVNQRLRDRVQVEITSAGDREPLFRILREDIGGRISEAIETLRGAADLSLPRFVEACRTGSELLTKEIGITPTQADRLARADPEVLMRIEELDLPPTTTIRLNTAPLGEPPFWQTLEDLSTGQKATAVLLLLLLESDAPLIVDQPEDDLDNRFITEGVVPRMREEKQRRQFVFSTHNANIPVLGDAELIIGLAASGEANGGHARIAREHMGSIDAQPVRELVEEILEGGKEAFERRRRKYGF